MSKRYNTSVPKGFAVCQHQNCSMAKTCLHQCAYNSLIEQEAYLNLINPQRCSQDSDCPFYRSSEKVVYARGFVQMQKQMYPDQYKRFRQILIERFSRSSYYGRRIGTMPICPREQAFIRDVLRQIGIDQEMEFDHYEESFNWFD